MQVIRKVSKRLKRLPLSNFHMIFLRSHGQNGSISRRVNQRASLKFNDHRFIRANILFRI